MSKNDITGDTLRSRELSPEGKENWDRIFGAKSDTMSSHQKERCDMPTGIFCPDCGTELDPRDHVFEVWFCPNCDAIVPEPDNVKVTDLPEAP